MLRRSFFFFLVALFCVLAARPARAWDETGHRVIAYIAWQHMTPAARAEAVRILRHAPLASDLRQLLPTAGPRAVRERTWFSHSAYWPDIVRDNDFPARRERYHRGNWHYTNYFWEQVDGEARDRPDLQPDATNIVERLTALSAQLGNPLFPSAQRAVALAWILHLGGDIHQPLHASARVTETEPKGDQGGNLFKLDGRNSLHWYWDSIIDATWARRPGEADAAFVARIAEALMHQHPPAEYEARMKPGAFDAWAQEGFTTAKGHLYPPDLKRGEAPSAAYGAMAYDISARAAALAGYRLAALLNGLLG